uniref:Uncharacterized protein n=1 Tax=Panagrellus redivivus TaxID=6233 RepID=A0A7E4WAF6_PANRE
MRGKLHLICVCLFIQNIYAAEKPSFFGSQIANELTGMMVDRTVVNHDVASKHGDVNADSIIGPIMQPIARMFNYVANSRGDDDTSEVVRRKPTSMFDPRAILDAVSNDEPNQTPSPSFMEKLFEPFVAPVKRELNKVKATTPANIFDGLFTTPKTPINADGTRRSEPHAPEAELKPSGPFELEQPLSNLLQNLGANADRNAEEVQIGRDRTVSVLGMPVGRRDGLALSPFKGLSYGNQDMFGPIAVNDKYNLQWDFLNKISDVFSPTPNGNLNLGGIMNMFNPQRQA